MSFKGLTLTDAGRNKIAAAVSEKNALQFEKIQLGDGTCSGPYAGKTGLSHMVMELPVGSVKREGNEVTIECDWTSRQAPGAFYLKEIGITGNGVLCYYDNTGNGEAEFIDPGSGAVVKQKRFRFKIIVTDDAKIDTVIPSALYALETDLQAFREENTENLGKKLDKDGDAADNTVTFSRAAERADISTGEKLSVILGKVAKWFADLKTVAFTGSYNDLVNKPAIPSVGNGTVTIRQAGTQKGTFTMNQSGNTTIELTDNNTTYSAGSQLELSGTGFKLKDFCTTITDWDAATTNGWYMEHNASHSPADGWIYGIVIAHKVDWVRQIVYHFGNDDNDVSGKNCDRYERIKSNGTWGAWVNTSVKKEIPGSAQIIREYTSQSTGADKAGCWYKIATMELNYRYNDATMHSFVYNHAHGDPEVYYIEYVARIKQQDNMGTEPLLDVSVCYRKGIAEKDLKFVVVENSGTVTRAELWFRAGKSYTNYINDIYSTDGNVEVNEDMTLQQNPPEGTGQFVYGTDKAFIHEADLLDGKHFSDIKTMIDEKQNIRNGVISGNANWNTFTIPGAYKVQSASMTDEMHAPNGERMYGVLYVIESERGGENRIMQLYFPHTSIYHDMWRRMRNGGTWTPWVGMYSTEHPSPDAKVAQNNTTDNKRLRLLLSHGNNNTDETNGACKNANLTFNPATGDLFALGWDRVDITGKTVDVDTINLSSGTTHIMRYIEKSSGGAANITNIPVAGNPFILDVFLIRWGSVTDYITRQDFYSAANNIEYTRYCVNGTWSAWKHKDTTYSVATQSAAGLMSADDKKKLDGIASGANAYSLPAASSTARGGVKTGYSQNGKNYPVQLSNEQMYVNVPWTDTNTTYGAATQSAAGLAKLYAGTGTNTDGALTQKAASEALNARMDKTTTKLFFVKFYSTYASQKTVSSSGTVLENVVTAFGFGQVGNAMSISNQMYISAPKSGYVEFSFNFELESGNADDMVVILNHWVSSGDTSIGSVESCANGSFVTRVESGWWLRIGIKGYTEWTFKNASFSIDYLTIE